MQFIRPHIFDPYFSSICQSCIALCCLYFALFKMRIFAKYVDILRLLIPFVLKPTTCNSDQTVAGTLKFGVKIDLAHFKAILGHSLKLSKINIEDLVQRNRTKISPKFVWLVVGSELHVNALLGNCIWYFKPTRVDIMHNTLLAKQVYLWPFWSHSGIEPMTLVLRKKWL